MACLAIATSANADCVIKPDGVTVVCTGTDADGFRDASDNLNVTVEAGAEVNSMDGLGIVLDGQNGSVTNHGTIRVIDLNRPSVFGIFTQPGNTVVNETDGLIEVEGSNDVGAIVVQGDVTNHGTITATGHGKSVTGIDFNSSGNTALNGTDGIIRLNIDAASGLLSDTYYGIKVSDSGPSVPTVTNDGLIELNFTNTHATGGTGIFVTQSSDAAVSITNNGFININNFQDITEGVGVLLSGGDSLTNTGEINLLGGIHNTGVSAFNTIASSGFTLVNSG
ncbi:MAG TPA: hypothetical protein ENJ57_02515, partial [Rhizobiales bacterium]|nr:hypothetical protein [Hyphomicrobiales bacterium]